MRDERFPSTHRRDLLSRSAILVAADLELREDLIGYSCDSGAVGPGQDEENKSRDEVDEGGAEIAPLPVGLHGVVDLELVQLAG